MNETLRSGSGIELTAGVWLNRSDVSFKFSRSGGPGGQNVNKLNTKAELRIRLESIHGISDRARERIRALAGHRMTAEGELLIVSEIQRSQDANRKDCLERLRGMVLNSIKEPKVRRNTRPTHGSVERRLQSKKARGQKKKERSGFRDAL